VVNPTVRGRGGAGTGTRPRSLMTAARAAAKRAEKAQGPDAAAGGETGGGATDQEKGAEPKGAEKKGAEANSAEPNSAEPRSAAEETDVEKEPVATAAKRSPVRSGIPGAVLAVLVLAGLIATALLAPEYYDAERTRQARTSALAAAERAAPVILSYDYRHLDRDFGAARGHLTGSFVDKYRKTTSTVVEPTAKKYKGVVKATVAKPPSGKTPAASVVSASPDRVVVLLFMNQVSKSTQVSGPRLDLNRVRMTLVRVSDGWKVSAVDAL
jgi:Mce-associated membrane protein